LYADSIPALFAEVHIDPGLGNVRVARTVAA
jgi:hypothetical protein